MLIVTVGKRVLFFLYVGKDDRFYANKRHGKYQMPTPVRVIRCILFGLR